MQPQLFVGIDVGCHKHSVAIADPMDFLEEFEINHDTKGFQYFFSRISFLSKKMNLPVVIGVAIDKTRGMFRFEHLDFAVERQNSCQKFYYLVGVLWEEPSWRVRISPKDDDNASSFIYKDRQRHTWASKALSIFYILRWRNGT